MAVQVGDVLEIGFQMSMYNQQYLTVLHYRTKVAPTVNTLPIDSQNAILNLITSGGAQDKVTVYRAVCTNELGFTSLSAQYIYPARSRKSFLQVGLTGTDVNPARTGNVSAVIEKQTDAAGRANRGSIHVPGVPFNQYQTGSILAGYNNLLVILASTLYLNITEGGGGAGVWEPIIFHRRNPATLALVWNAYKIQQTVRVMRRRTVGVGK